MGIIGTPPESFVHKQIGIRQKSLGGSGDTYKKSQLAYNTTAPWIRLASAVSITKGKDTVGQPGKSVYERIEETSALSSIKNSFAGDELSKNFVLFGGVNNKAGNSSPSGISDKNKTPFSSAYGFATLGDNLVNGRGFVPPPGITSVDFEYKNDGALAEAKINIKAFSEAQFAIIDILYQRPGYTCLLEFGHSTFLDNDGNIQYAGKGDYSYNTKPFEYLYQADGNLTSYSGMAVSISDEKSKWDGNYEAFFGRITKFNWKFNSDGSYDISVKLIGTGDVLQSLKANSGKAKKASIVTGNTKAPDKGDQEEAKEEGAIVISDALASKLNYELYSIFQDVGSKNSCADLTFKKFPIIGADGKTTLKTITIPKGCCKINVEGWFVDFDPATFITFGAFLALVTQTINLKDAKNQHLVNFDFNFENLFADTNLMATFPGNFSGNPGKALITYKPISTTITKYVELSSPTYVSKIVDTGAKFQLGLTQITLLNANKPKGAIVQDSLLGSLANVYVNVNFIAETLKNLRGGDPESDDEMDVSLLDLLNGVLNGINTALGGLNNFRVTLDKESGKVRIVSENPLCSFVGPPATILNTFGLTTDQGSFVRSMDLNSELTDKMATQITAGSQNNSSSNQGNGSAFSSYNKGLKDRLMVQKKDPESSEEEIEEEEDAPRDDFEAMFDDDASETFDLVYNDAKFTAENFSPLENLNSNFSKKAMEKIFNSGGSTPTFFLPFNLSITMDGLGGWKIYNGFGIDGKGLPLSYNPSSINLIIKSLSHTVSLEGWTTKISTLSVPLPDKNAPASKDSSTTSTAGSTSSGSSFFKSLTQGKFRTPPERDPSSSGGGDSSSGSGNIPAPPPSKPPADEKVRIILRRLADDGKQTYGVMTVLDESGKALYAFATVELPWKGNKNSVSCIPSNDTYRVKSYVSPKHGQCFFLIGNGKGGYKYDRLYGNGYTRSSVLIHKSPIAPGWLEGCIAPGFKFNAKQTMKSKYGGSNINPLGTGPKYRDPSLEKSIQAQAKLVGTLYKEGSFLMEIKNLGGVSEGSLPTSFYDPQVQNYFNGSPLYKPLNVVK